MHANILQSCLQCDSFFTFTSISLHLPSSPYNYSLKSSIYYTSLYTGLKVATQCKYCFEHPQLGLSRIKWTRRKEDRGSNFLSKRWTARSFPSDNWTPGKRVGLCIYAHEQSSFWNTHANCQLIKRLLLHYVCTKWTMEVREDDVASCLPKPEPRAANGCDTASHDDFCSSLLRYHISNRNAGLGLVGGSMLLSI